MRRAAVATLPAALLLVLCTSGARASGGMTYFASPTSAAAGPCTLAAPCRLDHAISAANAQPGNTVIVLPGTYSVTYGVSADKAITIEGEAGQPWPSLVGASNLGSDVVSVSGGATVQDLNIRATSNTGTAALSVNGGRAQALILSTSANDFQGAALSIGAASAATDVRTVLATSQAPYGAAVLLRNQGYGQRVSIDNLTAVGAGPTTAGMAVDVPQGTNAMVDSIVTGPAGDVMVLPGGSGGLGVSYSDFRPSRSNGASDLGHNVSSPPVFVNGASGDYHEATGSPTIAAGTTVFGQTAADLDGRAWTAGVAPDMGAYEYAVAPAGGSGGGSTASGGGTSTGSGAATGGSMRGGGAVPTSAGSQASGFAHQSLPAPTPPVLGVSVTVRPASGVVRVELPGKHRFVLLGAAAQLPVGSVVDATRGVMRLTSAVNRAGATKTGVFSGGAFVIQQPRHGRPRTDLRLTGGSFAVCTRSRIEHRPFVTTGATRARARVVRRLWGRDSGGNFVTIGRSASAAVRGTVWFVQDRCDGTLIHVVRGHVLVVDRVTHRHVVIGPGQTYLARRPR